MNETEELKKYLKDWKWRIQSGKLYKIKDKDGLVIPFIPNKYQWEVISTFHRKNIILKARQLGFSTAIQILLLDRALFYPNVACGVIAQTLPDAKSIFKHKIKFAYDNLPAWLKNEKTLTTDSTDTLEFGNGSFIYVSVSFRGGTLQYLHISEYGKICAKEPGKAREINTGAFEAVGSKGTTFIESTAEGKSGDFFDKVYSARALKKSGKELNEHEFKFYFFPWWLVTEYRLIDDKLILTSETKEYFEGLKELGIICDDSQMKWYQAKKDSLGEDIYREYPSTEDEAFLIAVKGSYYGKWIMEAYEKNRICKVPYDPKLALHVSFDLGGTGGGDNMDIWFFQVYGKEIRMVDWFTGNCLSILDVHSQILAPRGYKYETIFLPHDAEVKSMNDGKTRASQFRELGYNVIVLPRGSISDRIAMVRDNLNDCYIDKEKCGRGFDILKEYQRRWNESMGAFTDEPLHNDASHTADSFGYAIQAILNFLRTSQQSAKSYQADYGLDSFLQNDLTYE